MLANTSTSSLTKEQVIDLISKLPLSLGDYELDSISREDQLTYWKDKPYWSAYWSGKGDRSAGAVVEIDATTGKLLTYYKYDYGVKKGIPEKQLSRDEALMKARAFLLAVAMEEANRVSLPNQYPTGDYLKPHLTDHFFSFTRVEDGIPFLENYLQVVVDRKGEIIRYERVWHEGSLPSLNPVVTAEQAKNLWQKAVQPVLSYLYAGEQINTYGLKEQAAVLAYHYDEKAPVLLDAVTGKALNILGETLDHSYKIMPLGSSTPSKNEYKKLTEIKLREKADTLAFSIFGAEKESRDVIGSTVFMSSNQFGEGDSGPSTRLFGYMLPPDEKGEEKLIRIGLDPYGTLTSYEVETDDEELENRDYPNPIPWEKAQTIANDFMKRVYSDRLGEMYPIPLPPIEKSKASMFQRTGGYELTYGLLIAGIPVENAIASVTVHPVTGEVIKMNADIFHHVKQKTKKQAVNITAQEAKQVEENHRELRLTYYLPHPEWIHGTYLVEPEPKLVYRMVGDEGYVDAETGKWFSYTEYRDSKIPRDIAEHPHWEAMLHAVERGYLTVVDSKLNPEQVVTRGEFLRILVKASIYHRPSETFHVEEGETTFFLDIDESHPLRETMKEAMEIGLQAEHENEIFEPDRNITKKEAIEMLKLLIESSETKVPNKEMSLQEDAPLTRAQLASILYSLDLHVD
ncbi:YcdB/YcdC domain-containing protein [Brevibacillus migulae]|uniref:YcdB/YcdC domain-containing protein n=1 Tax=Brevibacillus migulae TaxID=1644114 RepID=UPI001431A6E3|nr:YcdB/YcdC domain-containing protein [Brevibacillus migulae]